MLIVMRDTVEPSRPLLEILKAQHDDRVLAYQVDKASREKHGVPMSDDIDWAQESKRAAAIVDAIGNQDADAVALGYQAGLMSVSSKLDDPGEWVAPEGLAGVCVRLCFPSAETTRGLRRDLNAAYSAGDVAVAWDVENQIILAGIKEVSGLTVADNEGEHPDCVVKDFSPDDLEAFRAGHLFVFLLTAVLYSWGLSRGKAWRSGAPPQAT